MQLVALVNIAAERAEVHLRFKNCQSLNLIRAVMTAKIDKHMAPQKARVRRITNRKPHQFWP